MNLTLLLEITVQFGQAMYTINENAGVVQVSLILSNPSSTAVMIQVFNADGSATGKYNNVHCHTYNYMLILWDSKVCEFCGISLSMKNLQDLFTVVFK